MLRSFIKAHSKCFDDKTIIFYSKKSINGNIKVLGPTI